MAARLLPRSLERVVCHQGKHLPDFTQGVPASAARTCQAEIRRGLLRAATKQWRMDNSFVHMHAGASESRSGVAEICRIRWTQVRDDDMVSGGRSSRTAKIRLWPSQEREQPYDRGSWLPKLWPNCIWDPGHLRNPKQGVTRVKTDIYWRMPEPALRALPQSS